MNPSANTIPFPAPRLAAWLTFACIVIAILQLSVLPTLLSSADPGVSFKVIVFVNLASWYAFMMSIIPLMVLVRVGPFGFFWGFCVGMLTRIVAALAIAGLMIRLALMPVPVVAVSLIITYSFLLATEAFVLYQYLGAKAALAPIAKPRPTEALS